MKMMVGKRGILCLFAQAAAGSIPTFGFYTYGEFARNRSVAGHHNATVAALAL